MHAEIQGLACAGIMVCAETVAEAFDAMYYLEQVVIFLLYPSAALQRLRWLMILHHEHLSAVAGGWFPCLQTAM